MFTYTKALPLALLISLPIFAMEDAALASVSAKPAVAHELLSTIVVAQQYERSSATCSEILARQDELSKQLTEVAKTKDEARTVLTAKVAAIDLRLNGILKSIEEQNEAKKARDTDKAQKETEFTTYNTEYTASIKAIAGKLAELKLDQDAVTTERKKYQDILDGTKKEVKASWNLLGWFGSSSK